MLQSNVSGLYTAHLSNSCTIWNYQMMLQQQCLPVWQAVAINCGRLLLCILVGCCHIYLGRLLKCILVGCCHVPWSLRLPASHEIVTLSKLITTIIQYACPQIYTQEIINTSCFAVEFEVSLVAALLSSPFDFVVPLKVSVKKIHSSLTYLYFQMGLATDGFGQTQLSQTKQVSQFITNIISIFNFNFQFYSVTNM